MRNKNEIEKINKDDNVRLNKFLSDAGVCSRREADRLIEDGRVIVNGKVAVMGQKVTSEMEVICNGKIVSREEKLILIAFNKPEGIECTTDKKNIHNIISFINYPMRIYPIGRLDKNSKGLLLLTNTGAIVNKILKASTYHEKEYEVTVDKPVTDEFINLMSKGVPILDTVTRPCKVRKTGRYSFNIILTQGLNRQIRRMCEYFGMNVTILKRIRIMNIKLGDLKEGKYRNLTNCEFDELKKQLGM